MNLDNHLDQEIKQKEFENNTEKPKTNLVKNNLLRNIGIGVFSLVLTGVVANTIIQYRNQTQIETKETSINEETESFQTNIITRRLETRNDGTITEINTIPTVESNQLEINRIPIRREIIGQNNPNTLITTTRTNQDIPQTTQRSPQTTSNSVSENQQNSDQTGNNDIENEALFSNISLNVKFQREGIINIPVNPNGQTNNIQQNQTRTENTNIVSPGTIIKGILLTNINTSLPGMAMARVTENVYNKQLDRIVIPQGTILLCDYSTDIEVHQNRIGLMWKRMVLPDGTVVDADENIADRFGAVGIPARVHRHILLRTLGIGMSLIYSTSAVVAARTTGNMTDDGRTIVEGTIQPVMEATSNIIDRMINIPNTLTVNRGSTITIITFEQLEF